MDKPLGTEENGFGAHVRGGRMGMLGEGHDEYGW